MPPELKYSFSFTGASALIPETLIVAEEYQKLGDWKAVEKKLTSDNLLQKVKQTTFKREFSEIKKRLTLLTDEQREILIGSNLEDVKAIVLISLCKTYALFKDFIVEVLRSKYLSFDFILTDVDYIKFINGKSISHEELINISEVTAKKVKQVVFKLLEQTNLISQAKEGRIIKPILSSKIIYSVINDDPSLLEVFLFSNDEIKIILQN